MGTWCVQPCHRPLSCCMTRCRDSTSDQVTCADMVTYVAAVAGMGLSFVSCHSQAARPALLVVTYGMHRHDSQPRRIPPPSSEWVSLAPQPGAANRGLNTLLACSLDPRDSALCTVYAHRPTPSRRNLLRYIQYGAELHKLRLREIES